MDKVLFAGKKKKMRKSGSASCRGTPAREVSLSIFFARYRKKCHHQQAFSLGCRQLPLKQDSPQ